MEEADAAKKRPKPFSGLGAYFLEWKAEPNEVFM